MSDQKTTHPTAAGKIRIRKNGNRWEVTFPCDSKDEFRRRLHEFELSAINHLRPTENIAGVCC